MHLDYPSLIWLAVWVIGTGIAWCVIRNRLKSPVEPLPHPGVPLFVALVWTAAISFLLFLLGLGLGIVYDEWPRNR